MADKCTSPLSRFKNGGNIATSGSASFNIGLSADGQTETTALETISKKLVIRAGHSAKLRLSFTIPTGQTAGMYAPFVAVSEDSHSATLIGSSKFSLA